MTMIVMMMSGGGFEPLVVFDIAHTASTCARDGDGE